MVRGAAEIDQERGATVHLTVDRVERDVRTPASAPIGCRESMELPDRVQALLKTFCVVAKSTALAHLPRGSVTFALCQDRKLRRAPLMSVLRRLC